MCICVCVYIYIYKLYANYIYMHIHIYIYIYIYRENTLAGQKFRTFSQVCKKCPRAGRKAKTEVVR